MGILQRRFHTYNIRTPGYPGKRILFLSYQDNRLNSLSGERSGSSITYFYPAHAWRKASRTFALTSLYRFIIFHCNCPTWRASVTSSHYPFPLPVWVQICYISDCVYRVTNEKTDCAWGLVIWHILTTKVNIWISVCTLQIYKSWPSEKRYSVHIDVKETTTTTTPLSYIEYTSLTPYTVQWT